MMASMTSPMKSRRIIFWSQPSEEIRSSMALMTAFTAHSFFLAPEPDSIQRSSASATAAKICAQSWSHSSWATRVRNRCTRAARKASTTRATSLMYSLLSVVEPLTQACLVWRPIKKRLLQPLSLCDLPPGARRLLPPREHQDGIRRPAQELQVALEERLPGRRPVHQSGHRMGTQSHPALAPHPGGHLPGPHDVADAAQDGRGSVWPSYVHDSHGLTPGGR